MKKTTFKPKKLILTAGPSITRKEIAYVNDAVRNGWNENWDSYIHKFEKAFAKYIGAKHAMAMAHCTGALHLSLVCLGIGKSDEVILPETSWIATANSIIYTGAKPVFVDVLPDTWVIDPARIEAAITKKTKAIMPVHIYGNPAPMNEIMKIAKKYKLFVVEDAAPSLGSEYYGKRPGSFGDFGCFSFQGAKIAVTGEGGMLVTNNTKLFEQARKLNLHGVSELRTLWSDVVGYKYWMSNLQAALGLAQLERIETLVNKKRQIFSWYQEYLGSVEGISLNYEAPHTKSIFWMSSLIMDRDFGVTREELRDKLRKRKIDTRPMFYPMSMFPMFKEQNTPVAHHIGLNGINMPSGYGLTKPAVEYICTQIKDILKVK